VQARTLAARGDLDAADRMLRALVAGASPGSLGGQPPNFKGLPHTLSFTANLPEAADALGMREADVSLAVDRQHRLLLLWLPHYRNRLGASPPPRQVVLLTGVERLEIAYWRDDADGKPGWQREWNEDSLPRLVRFHIVFAAGTRPAADARSGPDIVVAPRRDWWRT
jgi:hypothetical protein